MRVCVIRRTALAVGVIFTFFTFALAATAPASMAATSASATMELLSPATLGGKQLKPATYRVKADDTKVTLLQGKKVVAESAIQWKDEPAKSPYSAIVVDDSKVKEIHFSGKQKYIEINDGQ